MTIDATRSRRCCTDVRPGVDYAVVATGIGASPGGAKGPVVFSAPRTRSPRRPRSATSSSSHRSPTPATSRVRGRAGDPHRRPAARRARGARGTRDGPARRHRRGRAEDRRAPEAAAPPDGTILGEGDFVAINGTTGEITLDDVPVIDPGVSEDFSASSAGRTSSAGSACGPTPTRPRTRAGRRARGRGHRALPQRAHVPRRAPAADGRGDPGRGRRGARRGDRGAAPAAGGRLRADPERDGRAARSACGCSTRR